MRGHPAQRLSAHYRLDCDHGTRLLANYREGDPVFVCASHASTFGQLNDSFIAGVRRIEDQSAEDKNPAKHDQRIRTVESRPATYSSSLSSDCSLDATKVARTRPESRRSLPDVTYGNSAKALVEEAIWNLPTGDLEVYKAALQEGKTASEAAQSAGGQFAVIHRRIAEYTRKIEEVLARSKATIDARRIVDSEFEHAVLQIISNVTMNEIEKDRAIVYLGEFQQQINRGLEPEITPLEAHRIVHAIGERANWGNRSCLSEELKPAFRAVYTGVREAVNKAVPEARELDERLTNLYAAKTELENKAAEEVVHS